MRIAIYKPIVPWPPLSGTSRVSHLVLEALAPEHEVTLFAPSLSPADEAGAGELERRFGIRVVTRRAPNRLSPWHRAIWKGRTTASALLGRDSPRAIYATPEPLLHAAADWSRDHPADLAIFEYWYSYRAFDAIQSRRRVLFAHDADFRVAEGGRRPYAALEARREAAACRAADRVWVLTEADRDALAHHSGRAAADFDRVPFGIDLEPFDRPAGSDDETLLFFGAFQADFNVDALRWLLEAIWPRVKRARPSARLVVAGGGLVPSLAALVTAGGGEVRGAVENVPDLLARARVMIIPLRFGGGLRIRLIEALAARRAVVATPIGIGERAGEADAPWRIGRTAEELAREVIALLADREAAIRLGEAARADAAAHASQEGARETIRRLVERAAAP